VKHRIARDTGVIDQDLDRADIGGDVLHAVVTGGVVGDIGAKSGDVRFGGKLGCGRLIASVIRRHAIAGFLEGYRDRSPDTARSSK
jgi:hypothetical protein